MQQSEESVELFAHRTQSLLGQARLLKQTNKQTNVLYFAFAMPEFGRLGIKF